MTDPVISVIVPVYKIKPELLNHCLTSLLKQKYDSAEFIIIDDGSPDNCGEICDEYAEKDSRMKVFHLENAGVSSARNFGIRQSMGKYILFLDGDDFFIDGFLSKIAEIALNQNADIMFFKGIKCKENELDFFELPDATDNTFNAASAEVIAAAIVANNDRTTLHVKDVTFGAPWGKVFSADYIKKNKIEFPLGIRKSQDRIFVLRSLSFNPKMIIADSYGYAYVINSTSICNRYNPDIIKIADDASACFYDTIINYYSEKNRPDLLKAYNYLVLDFFFIITQLYFFNSNHNFRPDDSKLFVDMCKKRTKYFRNCSAKGLKKKRGIILMFLKTGLYKPLFYILKCIYRV